jgi:hypothetical protein
MFCFVLLDYFALSSILKLETESSPATSVNFCKTIWRHISEESILLSSDILFYFFKVFSIIRVHYNLSEIGLISVFRRFLRNVSKYLPCYTVSSKRASNLNCWPKLRKCAWASSAMPFEISTEILFICYIDFRTCRLVSRALFKAWSKLAEEVKFLAYMREFPSSYLIRDIDNQKYYLVSLSTSRQVAW